MKLVLDVSVALSWCFGDEADPYGEAVLHVLEDHEALVPALWCQEMSNVLLSAKRRKRLDSKQLERALRFLGELPIEVVPLPRNVVFERVLPLVKEHGAAIIALTNGELGIPVAWEERFEFAKRLVDIVHGKWEIPMEDIVIDPLAMPVGAEPQSAVELFKTIEAIRTELDLNMTLGASNTSFGLPGRHGSLEEVVVDAEPGRRLGFRHPSSTPWRGESRQRAESVRQEIAARVGERGPGRLERGPRDHAHAGHPLLRQRGDQVHAIPFGLPANAPRGLPVDLVVREQEPRGGVGSAGHEPVEEVGLSQTVGALGQEHEIAAILQHDPRVLERLV